jgi:hypothetical protein
MGALALARQAASISTELSRRRSRAVPDNDETRSESGLVSYRHGDLSGGSEAFGSQFWRSNADLPTALSRYEPLVSGADFPPAFPPAGRQSCGRRAAVLPVQPLARQVFRSLLGELPMERSGSLADFDHVAVGISHVAADLSTAIDRRRDELGPL